MPALPDLIILFDGVCNLCNRSVQFVIKHDKQKQIHFAALQSEAGKKLLQQHNLTDKSLNSFVFIENGKAHTQSTAALHVSKYLSGGFKLLYGFLIVPPFIRNAVYRFIANNRYKWFGKQDECMIPTPELEARFLH